MEKQTDKSSYNFIRYCDPDRWVSYWHQLNLVFELAPKTVLEIGVGDRVFGSYLKSNTRINYICVDIADDLSPDILGSIDNLPLKNDSFDLVCAFEVLEHLPFSKFEESLRELYRVSCKDVLISLPYWGRYFSFDMRLPLIKRLRFGHKFSFFVPKHEFNGQHYWEIGKRGYPLKLIKRSIENCGFKIVKDYTAFESPYHHFFMLKK